MSIDSIKDTAMNVVNTAGTAAKTAAKWTFDKVVWLKDTVVSWNLPSKAATGLRWTASKVQSLWQKSLPLLAAVGAFLISNNGLVLIGGLTAVALLIAAEKCPQFKDNEWVRIGLHAASVAAAAFAGFAFGTSAPIIA